MWHENKIVEIAKCMEYHSKFISKFLLQCIVYFMHKKKKFQLFSKFHKAKTNIESNKDVKWWSWGIIWNFRTIGTGIIWKCLQGHLFANISTSCIENLESRPIHEYAIFEAGNQFAFTC